MTDETEIGEAVREIRARLDALRGATSSPALAAVLRQLAEIALDAEGYAAPEGAPLLPSHYQDTEDVHPS